MDDSNKVVQQNNPSNIPSAANPVMPPPIQPGSMPVTAFVKPAAAQTSISVTPEGGAIEVKPNISGSGVKTEYGYDAIKQIEQKAEQTLETREKVETIEAKEPKSPQPAQQQPVQLQPVNGDNPVLTSQTAPAFKLPPFTGFQLSEESQKQDTQLLIGKWKKDDKHDSEFGLALFLERLLLIEASKLTKDK